MYRIRNIAKDDFAPLFSLILQTHLGLTNLPKDPNRFKSFFETALLQDNLYLFILENEVSGEILGISGIYGKAKQSHYFKIDQHPLSQLFPEIPSHTSLLTHVIDQNNLSEICALFLAPKARNEGLGKLLSFSRFLFMAAYPERFQSQVFADMRGYLHVDGSSPFWNAVGRPFFQVSFKRLMEERDKNEAIMLPLMPTVPIYLHLLPKEARDCIGKTHIHTTPALEMLLKQGFKRSGEFDLYEGGPRIMANFSEIELIKNSQTFQIKAIDKVEENSLLISNEKLQFRACIGNIDIKTNTIDQKTANALEVQLHDTIRVAL